MKTATITLAVMLGAAVIWSLGYRTGALDEGMKQRAEIETLTKLVQRYESREVWKHAKKVSAITGTDFYQVMTGYR